MIWNDIDLDLKFMLKKQIEFHGIGFLHPILLDEVIEVGYDIYNKNLSLLCISTDDIKTAIGVDDESVEIEPFDFLFENCKYNEEFKKDLTDSISYFFKDSSVFDEGIGGFFIGIDGILHRDNFDFVIEVLMKQNCIEPQQMVLKPKNEKEKEYFEKLKIAKEKYKVKNGMELNDIVSSVCAKHPSINVFNVGQLSMYQLIDQYRRLNHIDEFYIGIDSLMHGASQDNVQIVHWSDKYKK